MFPRPVSFSLMCALTVALSACGGGGSSSGGGSGGDGNRRPTVTLSSIPLSPTGRTGELVELTAVSEDRDLNDNLSVTWEIEPDYISINGPTTGGDTIIKFDVDTGSGGANENILTSIRHFHMPDTVSGETITVTVTTTDSAGASSSDTLTFNSQPTPQSSSASVFSRASGWENLPAGGLIEVLAGFAGDQVLPGSIDGKATYFVPNESNTGYLWINSGLFAGDHLLTLPDPTGGVIHQVFTTNSMASGWVTTAQYSATTLALLAQSSVLGNAAPTTPYEGVANELTNEMLSVGTAITANAATLLNDPASVEANYIRAINANNFPLNFSFVVPNCANLPAALQAVTDMYEEYSPLMRYRSGLVVPGIDMNGALKRNIIDTALHGLLIQNVAPVVLGLINGCKQIVVSDIDPVSGDYTPLVAGAISLDDGADTMLYGYGVSGQSQQVNDAVVALNTAMAVYAEFEYEIPDDVLQTDTQLAALDVAESDSAEASCTAAVAGSELVLNCAYTGAGAPQDAQPFDLTFTDPAGEFAAFVLENVTFNAGP